jgi:uncharacterized protein (DUF4415 family)
MSVREKGRPAKRPLTKRQRAEIAALAALSDDTIDPWRFYRPVKQAVTLRLDADVLAWFRSHGPGYQTRINRLLRSAMEAQRTHRARRRRTGAG